MKLSILFTLLSFSVFSQVWVPQNTWKDDPVGWEEKYQSWVSSESVYAEMFLQVDSPYYELELDCADLVYALRIIFSYENSLNFKVKNPVRGKRKYYGQDLTWWNKYPESKRVRKFIEYITDSIVGTESLAHYDSYPIALEAITDGDFLAIKSKLPGQNYITKHVYVMKKLNPIGLFDVIYSTQKVKANKWPLWVKEQRRFSDFLAPEKMHWGFKRFMQPWQYTAAPEEITDYSLNQYEYIKKNTNEGFFDHVQNLHATVKEDIEVKSESFFKDICDRFKERITVVEDALTYKDSINNRCVNFSEYDVHSTPLRDTRIRGVLSNINKFIQEENDGGEYFHLLKLIFSSDLSEVETQLLQEQCPLQTKDYTLRLNVISQKIINKEMSYHPNDILEHRWGIEVDSPRTSCKDF